MNRISFLILFLFSLLLSSCDIGEQKLPELDISDGGIISGVPCSAPCFWKIIPGTTSEVEAVKILSQLGDIQNCKHIDKVKNGADKLIRCANIGVTFNDGGVVSRLSFDTPKKITVGEVIKKYGNPDKVSLSASGTESTGPLLMLLLFDDEQMVIGLPEQKHDLFSVDPTIVISSILYCEIDVYKRFEVPIYTQSWKGYGEY